MWRRQGHLTKKGQPLGATSWDIRPCGLSVEDEMGPHQPFVPSASARTHGAVEETKTQKTFCFCSLKCWSASEVSGSSRGYMRIALLPALFTAKLGAQLPLLSV